MDLQKKKKVLKRDREDNFRDVTIATMVQWKQPTVSSHGISETTALTLSNVSCVSKMAFLRPLVVTSSFVAY